MPTSSHHYQAGREIENQKYLHGWPFYGLIQAAMRTADSDNLLVLIYNWPEEWADYQARLNAPGGVLPTDNKKEG